MNVAPGVDITIDGISAIRLSSEGALSIAELMALCRKAAGGKEAIDGNGMKITLVPKKSSMWDDIKAFHEKFGVDYQGKPRFLEWDLAQFREKFIREEFDEYLLAINDFRDKDDPSPHECERCLADALDSLVDLVYVTLGAAYLHGFNFEEAWRRVHAANMAKVRAASAEESKRNSTHDVIKPPGWKAPDHTDLVADNIYS